MTIGGVYYYAKTNPVFFRQAMRTPQRLLAEGQSDGCGLCGHSSGGSLALHAAASGLVSGLALWETPLAPPDSGARQLSDDLRGSSKSVISTAPSPSI